MSRQQEKGFIATFDPFEELIQLGIQVAIVAFLHKPKKRLGQGQSVGYLQKGMLQQGCNIAYLNNTLKNWGVMGGEE